MHTPVKGYVRHRWVTTADAIRERVREWLREEGWSARRLAHELELPEKSVQRWVSEEATKGDVTAELVGRMEEKGLASARWLLTGDPPRKPMAPRESDQRLETIRRLLSLGLRIANDAEIAELEAFLETIPWEGR